MRNVFSHLNSIPALDFAIQSTLYLVDAQVEFLQWRQTPPEGESHVPISVLSRGGFRRPRRPNRKGMRGAPNATAGERSAANCRAGRNIVRQAAYLPRLIEALWRKFGILFRWLSLQWLRERDFGQDFARS
jgi:hypothetical protein